VDFVEVAEESLRIKNASMSSASSSQVVNVPTHSQFQTSKSKPNRGSKKTEKLTDADPGSTDDTTVRHICFFCINSFNSKLSSLSKNVIVVCDDCLGKREEFRQAILGYQCVIDRLNKLESQCTNIDSVTVSKQVKTNSDLIKQISDKQEIKDRKTNLILYGLDEHQIDNPEPIVRDILSHLELPDLSCSTARIGKSRLARISFSLENDRHIVLKNSKKLKGHINYGKVYLNPDLPPNQLEANKKLRLDLKTYRLQKPEEKFIIKNGQIMQKLQTSGTTQQQFLPVTEPIVESDNEMYYQQTNDTTRKKRRPGHNST